MSPALYSSFYYMSQIGLSVGSFKFSLKIVQRNKIHKYFISLIMMICKAIFAIKIILLIRYVEGRDGIGPGEQEWGYTTVRPGAHMFWWLYYTTANVSSSYYEKPLIIWLQGGPSASSTGFGNFMELGPLDENLRPRNYTWVKYYNMLFIDNPVGTGFSYVDSFDVLAKSMQEIGADLLVCIKNFYKKFPEFSYTPAYIIGESYGGKYTAEFAKVWYQEQENNLIKSNLKGIALGNSFISPVHIIPAMGEFVYQMGFLDTHTFHHLKTVYEKFEVAVETENWSKSLDLALVAHQIILDGSININVYNVLDRKPPLYNATNVSKLNNSEFNYLMNHQIKKALGLNSTFKPINLQVRHVLRDDFMKAVTDQIEYLLNVTDVKVYVYSGQLDAMCPTSGAVKWLDSLKWENSTKWYSSARTPLVVNNVLEGYVKEHGNLKMFWINRAGHMAPAENPNAVLAVLEDLTATYNNTNY